MSNKLIEPKVLKGFQDTLPNAAIQRREMVSKIESVFCSFGFAPIDTPALEYTEILLGKGSNEADKQMFRFNDQGGRDVSMRFDLTIPLARFAALHQNELTFPFKRYHIAPVWRAEKPQKGRYREFIQCDFDTIGTDSKTADAEIVAVICSALEKIKIDHQVRINNRKILNGVLENLSVRDRSASVLRAIDKLEKIGKEAVEKELAEEARLNASQIESVFKYVELSKGNLEAEILFKELKIYLGASELGLQGLSELMEVYATAQDFGCKKEDLEIDLTIARGLDYYTGTVFETRLRKLPTIGSICSGGRYDDLASLYTKRRLPGVGSSIGLDRILGALEELGSIDKRTSPANVYVSILDESAKQSAIKIGTDIRKQGIACEVALESASLGGQLKYADLKGIEFAVIIGSSEISNGKAPIKNLKTKEQSDPITFSEIPNYLLKAVQG
jgi:histidyl-tRNA synthetase